MPSNPLLSQYIIGDPGAGSGCMYAINAFKPYSSPNKSRQTQGQIVGMRESLNGRGKNGAKTFPRPHYLPLGWSQYTQHQMLQPIPRYFLTSPLVPRYFNFIEITITIAFPSPLIPICESRAFSQGRITHRNSNRSINDP